MDKILNLLSWKIHFWMVVAFYASLSEPEIFAFVFNSDYLYVPSLYRDLVLENGSLSEWHLTPAPYFFPDIFFYFLTNSIISDFRWATFTYCLIQYIAVLILMAKCCREVFPVERKYLTIAGNLAMSVFLLAGLTKDNITVAHFILTVSAHMGSFVIALACLLCMIRYQKRRSFRYLAAVFFLGFLGLISDRLLLVQFFVPVSLACFILLIFRRRSIYFFALATTGLGFLAGNIIFLNVIRNITNVLDVGHQQIDVYDSFHRFILQLTHFLVGGGWMSILLSMALLSWVLHAWKLLKYYWAGQDTLFFYTLLIFLSANAAIFAAPALGMYTNTDTLRYSIHGFYLLVFHLPFVFPQINFRFARIGLFCQTAAISIYLLLLLPDLGPGLRRFQNCKPAYVKLIDQHAQILERGMADYWTAKPITFFSERKIKAVSVNQDLQPVFHECSELAYTGNIGEQTPFFNFVVDIFNPAVKSVGVLDSISGFGHTLYILHPFRFRKQADGRTVRK